MGDHGLPIPDAVRGALRASGFPFQTAVEHTIRTLPGWTVDRVEFPWRDPNGTDQFLDLVVLRGTLVLLIECKKTRNEVLTFLQPRGLAMQRTDRARLLYARQIRDMTNRLVLECASWGLAPESPEAAFCVVSTTAGGRDQRLLERDAQRLVRAADGFAQQQVMAFRGPQGEPLRPYVPVLVTNATICSAEYDPSAVLLDSGELPQEAPEEVTHTPWTRFFKSFTSAGGRDLGDRTVFVVSAASLADFLRAMTAPPREPDGVDVARLPRLDGY